MTAAGHVAPRRRPGAGAEAAANADAPTAHAVRAAARETLGFRRLLPGQEEAVRAVLAGRDTLALLPTGGGKSAIYQLAAVERPGPTVVVSPLLALQQDQLESLDDERLGGAAALNSTLSDARRAEVLEAFAAGRLEFLLLAPEQLAIPEVLDRVADAHPSLFVVDEVHCVSEWGHDFRPEYRRLAAVAEAIGRPPILGLTATASPAVRDEIAEWLRLRDPVVVARGFDRPNLRLSVETHADGRAKRRALVEWVVAATPPGIVYVATRRGAEEVAAELSAAGVTAAVYHAGLAAGTRARIQDDFMADRIGVVVATIAFGMGIDKPNVRFVAHHDISDGLDAYHQEIGRAGRDGEPADAVLFYRAEDLGLRRFQGAPAVVTEADARAVVAALRRRPGAATTEVAKAARRSVRRTDAIVGRLEALGTVSVEPNGSVHVVTDRDARQLAADVVAAQDRRRRMAASRVEMLRAYAEGAGCRRRFLLNYLGEEYEPPCGNCDRCLAADGRVTSADGSATDAATDADRADVAGGPFALNDRVRHATYGPGLVSRVEGDRVVVQFDDAGYRTLALGECLERGLLRRAD
ncbi:MAG TPA: ATP-dependent DNA helicase RecQ [Candidatus Limnocylindrales bacterium]